MRRLPITRAAALVAAAGAVLGVWAGVGGGAASAQEPEPQGTADVGVVDVVEVSGHLDPVLVEFIQDSIRQSATDGSQTLVLQLNSPGAVVGGDEIAELSAAIRDAPVPIAIWVGPSGSEAKGAAGELWSQIPIELRGIASGATVEIEATDAEGVRGLAIVSDEEALAADLVEAPAPVLRDFLIQLPGFQTEVREVDGESQRVLLTQTRFLKLPLGRRLLHTVASPPIAYLLLTVGMGLILFEFYTAGIGVAGVTGAVCFVLAGYGLAVLPTTAIGVALLAVAMLGFAIDVQAGVPRLWTGIGVATFVAGSLLLFDGVSIGWLPLVAGIGGMMLAMISGMPAMVRARFSTPTIGREWMIGAEGEATDAVSPEGTVRIHDALWRARTNRATPIAAGEPLRVTGIDGLVLEVEPLVGAARDYRH